MSAIEMTNVVNATQSGKQPEVESSLNGTAVSASEGELLVAAILRHKELPHICYHSGAGANRRISIGLQCYFGDLGTGMSRRNGTKSLFAGRHFDREVILLCVRWYLAIS
jgi:hypothetical protein